jgi:hypothetical protein
VTALGWGSKEALDDGTPSRREPGLLLYWHRRMRDYESISFVSLAIEE